jgi:hypothetical protein
MHVARQKRSRRTKEQMDELLAAVQGVLDNYDGDRISVRQLCYRLASVGVIAKTEREVSGNSASANTASDGSNRTLVRQSDARATNSGEAKRRIG